jgi:hypothetical protein
LNGFEVDSGALWRSSGSSAVKRFDLPTVSSLAWRKNLEAFHVIGGFDDCNFEMRNRIGQSLFRKIQRILIQPKNGPLGGSLRADFGLKTPVPLGGWPLYVGPLLGARLPRGVR